jgi:hypothetical protein
MSSITVPARPGGEFFTEPPSDSIGAYSLVLRQGHIPPTIVP